MKNQVLTPALPPVSFSLLILFFLLTHAALAQMQITFTVSNYNGTNVSCFGSKDGSVTVHVTGGTPPYTYLWSNDATTATITGCSADYYGVTVTDSTNTMAEDGINLTTPAILKPILTAYEYNNGYNISLYGASNGSITTTVDGGVSPFTYEWEDGPATQNRTMLGGGFYNLTVTDANNCLASVQTILSEPERDDWTMNGNANSNPATQFIGTTDAKDFVMKTHGTERLRIKSDGVITMPSTTHFDKLVAHRITSPDSLIYIGDSTIIFQGNANRFWGDPFGTTFRGIAMGSASFAYGQFSSVIGHFSRAGIVGGAVGANADESVLIGSGLNAGANAVRSIVIGGGITGGASMTYNLPHSIAMGINSSIPTVVVSQANGAGTTGNVGIGTGINIPINKTDINGAVAIGTYASVNTAPSNGLIISGNTGIGTATPVNRTDISGAVAIGTYAGVNTAPTNGLIVSGSTGIGTAVPLNKTDINGAVAIGSYAGSNTAPLNTLLIVSGKTGIGTPSPAATLQVNYVNSTIDGSVAFVGAPNPTQSFAPPITGSGTRMMWYPDYGAFRSGYVGSNIWDQSNTGLCSSAMGWETKASGMYSFAVGYATIASGISSVSIGNTCTASGLFSCALNKDNVASGDWSLATGLSTTASNNYSMATGYGTIASGIGSTAINNQTLATGDYSFAANNGNTASGLYSSAFNSGSTAVGEGSFATGHTTANGDYSATFGNASSFLTATNSAAFGLYSNTVSGRHFWTG